MDRLQEMSSAAVLAGTAMLSASDKIVSEKTNSKDFATAADIKAQGVLCKQLSARFPGSVILSEEDDEATKALVYAADFTGFVIDPIDGTYNFKRGMRESAISIGYVENGEAIAGVIYDPYKNEMFKTELGQGAWLNDQRIQVSQQTDLRGASIATSNGYDDAAAVRNLQRQIAIHEQTGVMPWTSCPGSVVLTMAWVACGRIDGFHHNGLKPWDNATALLLVREAGGVVEPLSGGVSSFTMVTVLMGNPNIRQQLRTVFSQLPPDLMT
jgi:myo-inositol-1(or 4)-monophosphatase